MVDLSTQNLHRVSSSKWQRERVEHLLTICLSSRTACQKKEKKTHNLALAAPSIMLTFRAEQSPTTNTEHQSVVDRVLISTWMFCAFMVRYVFCSLLGEGEREANGEVITAKSISHMTAFRSGERQRRASQSVHQPACLSPLWLHHNSC